MIFSQAPLGRDCGPGYIALSTAATAGLAADLRSAGRGKTDTVTDPPRRLQDRGARCFGWGRMNRSARCSRRMSRLQLAWRKPALPALQIGSAPEPAVTARPRRSHAASAAAINGIATPLLSHLPWRHAGPTAAPA